MHSFNYTEFCTQASDLLNMSQFYKISITKRNHRKPTEEVLGFPRTVRQNTLNSQSKYAIFFQ